MWVPSGKNILTNFGLKNQTQLFGLLMLQHKMKIFLDLEDTIIHTWNDPVLCNFTQVKDFLTDNNITKVSIFSFAIWDDKDKKVFETQLKPFLESALNVEIIEWPSVDEMIDIILTHFCIKFDRHEFITVWGKSRAFFDFCKATQIEDCLLIDDVVTDETLTININNRKFSTKNVSDI